MQTNTKFNIAVKIIMVSSSKQKQNLASVAIDIQIISMSRAMLAKITIIAICILYWNWQSSENYYLSSWQIFVNTLSL